MHSAEIAVIGARGFVGSSIVNELTNQGLLAIPIMREHVNLSNNSITALSQLISNDSIIVFSAAIAPTKNLDDFFENMIILRNFIISASKLKPLYVLNVSSDAIYPDSSYPLTEDVVPSPTSIHGLMHFVRESLLNIAFPGIVGHIRPTLIYGATDPHNGYGPNSFMRNALKNSDLTLFGAGEELRDHVYIGDVAKLAVEMIKQQVPEAVNAASGNVVSFFEIAQSIVGMTGKGRILFKTREQSVPHNGYRPISIDKAVKMFPGLNPLQIVDGLQSMYGEIMKHE